MTQPKFAPIAIEDEVRPIQRLDVPKAWVSHRPGELNFANRLGQRGSGTGGPDQGYALHLAERLEGQLKLGPSEHVEDATTASLVVALLRAAHYGRAPVIGDLELGYAIFGYLDEAPPDLRAFRAQHCAGLAHDDWRQRELSAIVAPATITMKASAARASLSEWRSFFAL